MKALESLCKYLGFSQQNDEDDYTEAKIITISNLDDEKFEERFLMKENKEIEQILLNDSSYEKFVSTKVEKEFIQEINNPEIKKKR